MPCVFENNNKNYIVTKTKSTHKKFLHILTSFHMYWCIVNKLKAYSNTNWVKCVQTSLALYFTWSQFPEHCWCVTLFWLFIKC